MDDSADSVGGYIASLWGCWKRIQPITRVWRKYGKFVPFVVMSPLTKREWIVTHSTCAKMGCALPLFSQKNFFSVKTVLQILEDHTMKTVAAKSAIHCIMICDQHFNCTGVNM